MPEMDGIELARAAPSELDPDIKIMFITALPPLALNSDSRSAEERQGACQAVSIFFANWSVEVNKMLSA